MTGVSYVSPFRVIKRGWLVAEVVESGALVVTRSRLVKDSDEGYGPVREYVAGNGLVLGSRWEEPAPGWLFGSVEVSVFVTPESRNRVYGSV